MPMTMTMPTTNWRLVPVMLRLAAILILSSCAGKTKDIVSHTIDIPDIQKTRVVLLDYENRDSGAVLPAWVNDYLYNDIAAIESRPEFGGQYVFIAEQSSSSLNVLGQWARNFIPGQDFSQLVFLRVYDRLVKSSDDNPDHVYGPFFESLVKKTVLSFWPDAAQKDRIWILVRENGQDVYKLLLLCVIDADKLQKELMSIMNGIELDKKTFTRSQIQAVNRIKSGFFASF
jgi:hypothetical protein